MIKYKIFSLLSGILCGTSFWISGYLGESWWAWPFIFLGFIFMDTYVIAENLRNKSQTQTKHQD